MEFLFGVLLIALLAAIVLGPILGFVALARLKEIAVLRSRVEELATQVRALGAREERRAAQAEDSAPALDSEPTARQPPPAPAAPPAPPALPTAGVEAAARHEAPTPPSVREPAPPVTPRDHPPPRPSLPPRTPAAQRPAIEWERWIGVRGAALLGGIVLALAGLLFFQYSIQQGWISPAIRVALGMGLGVAVLLASEQLRRRAHGPLANALAGAAIVILYAATWAAYVRYALIGALPAWVLMALVTTTACLLAVRHAALVVAVLGLAGGFATPLLLSTNSQHPSRVFLYVLLLDVGVLAVARRRGWPLLGILSVFGTALIQFAWVWRGFDTLPLVVALGAFAGLYTFASRGVGDAKPTGWLAAQATGVLLPFLFALNVAWGADGQPGSLATCALVVILAGAAAWVSHQQGAAWLASAGAASAVAVLGTWVLRSGSGLREVWFGAATAVALALVQAVFVERDGPQAGPRGSSPATLVAALGGLAALSLGSLTRPAGPLAPWLVGQVALVAILARHDARASRGRGGVAGAFLLAVGLFAWRELHDTPPVAHDPGRWLLLLCGLALAALAACLVVRSERARRRLTEVAGTFAIVTLVTLLASSLLREAGAAPALHGALVLGLSAALAGILGRDVRAVLVAAACVAAIHAWWSWYSPGASEPQAALRALVLEALAVLCFAAVPLVSRAVRLDAWAWRTTALAAPLWLLPMLAAWRSAFTDAAIGVVPLALAGVAVAGMAFAQRRLAPEAPVRRTAVVWLAAAALLLVAVAVPLQLDKEWITIGWALQGLGLIVLWRRLDHPGLKWLGVALLAFVTVRLVMNGAVLGYHPRGGWRLVNWLLYTYAVPAACLVTSAILLAKQELGRVRDFERGLYAAGRPIAAVVCGLGAVAVGFVWVNLTVFDWFGGGSHLAIPQGRLPARDVTLSLAWAAYALLLLAIGMARSIGALRWLSLGVLLLAIGKVFLHDVGRLEDLYRVLSLLGLAVSLILVSFLYQRFVFSRAAGSAGAGVPPP